MLWGYIDPSLSPGHHRLSIDSSKAKLVGDSQPSPIGAPYSTAQGVSVGGVGNEVLYIPPGQTRTMRGINTLKLEILL